MVDKGMEQGKPALDFVLHSAKTSRLEFIIYNPILVLPARNWCQVGPREQQIQSANA